MADNQFEQSADFIQNTDQVLFTQSKNLSEQLDSYVALEVFKNYINQRGVISKENLMLANIAIEGIVDGTSAQLDSLIFTDDKNLTASLEEIDVCMENLWDSIVNTIRNISVTLGSQLSGYRKHYFNLKQMVDAIEEELKTISLKEPKLNIIKPRVWFSNFLYTTKPVSTNAVSIIKDMNKYIETYREMSAGAIVKYSDWLNRNYKEVQYDLKPLSTLSADIKDLVYNESGVFQRSVGSYMVRKDNYMYRSKELPGGKALYTQMKTSDRKGQSAIVALNEYKVFISEFDPISYNKYQYNLYNLSKMTTGAFFAAYAVAAGVTFGTAAVGLIGVGVNAYLKDKATVENTVATTHLNKNDFIKTMSVDEIKSAVRELKKSLIILNRFYTDVLENNVKNSVVDKILNEAFIKNPDPTDLQSKRALRRLCTAVLNLIETFASCNTAYTYKTYMSLAMFVQLNIKQYKE